MVTELSIEEKLEIWRGAARMGGRHYFAGLSWRW
jgi:hypothetical protein